MGKTMTEIAYCTYRSDITNVQGIFPDNWLLAQAQLQQLCNRY